MTESARFISFDRAVAFYDETRGFPPGIAEQIGASAANYLAAGASLLELGIGTGRIAKPLLKHGLQVTGVDISRGMMENLVATVPPGSAVPDLVQSDGAWLPFASNKFDAVIAVHVLHLIYDWRRAIEETWRVLQPGGFLLSGYDWSPEDCPIHRLRGMWHQIAIEFEDNTHSRAYQFDQVMAFLSSMDCRMEEWIAADWTASRTLEAYIKRIEQRTWSSTWQIPEEKFPVCLSRLREWALSTFGSLDQEITVQRRFIWQKYSF